MAAAATTVDAKSTKNLKMGDLMARFRCEDSCRAYLEALRWPDGLRCVRCGSDKVVRIKNRPQYECRAAECGYHFSVTAGTKLHDSHLELWKWFLVAYLMIHSKKGMSAKQIQRMLGGSYKTAWYLCHRIRGAMAVINKRDGKLSGIIEIDETLVGGKVRTPDATGHAIKFDNKEIVMAAVERGGRVRFGVVRNRGKGTIQKFIKDVTEDATSAYYTDEHGAYNGIGDDNTDHRTVTHSKFQWVNGQVHTNTVEGVFSLLKRAIIGAYHKVGSQHLQAYLEEIAFKYNNRSNPYLFRETLKALLFSEPLEYKKLTS
jgi:transposase-like protein